MGSERYGPNDHAVQHIGGPVPYNQSWGGKGDLLAVETVSVTVRGQGLILSIVHLPPLTVGSPFTFTVLLIFFADTF